ncbi:MAG: hypothetical protein ACRD23_06200 [Terriglobales bacterium]
MQTEAEQWYAIVQRETGAAQTQIQHMVEQTIHFYTYGAGDQVDMAFYVFADRSALIADFGKSESDAKIRVVTNFAAADEIIFKLLKVNHPKQ